MAQTLRSPLGKKIIYGGIGLGVLQVLLGALGLGEDDWDEIPEFEKAKNLILPIPMGDKNYTKIPMPLGFNILPNIGRSVTEMAYFRNRWAERSGNLVMAVFDSLNPLGGNNALSAVMPSFLDPAVEVSSNRDAFGRPIYRENFSALSPAPGHARARESTAAPWVAISRAVNWITGGDEEKPGMVSPPPEALSYLFGVALGGVGREADKAFGFLGNLVSGTETPPYRIPVLSRFYGEANGDAATKLRQQTPQALCVLTHSRMAIDMFPRQPERSAGEWVLSQSFKAASMRVCQPLPVALKASSTAGVYRRDTSRLAGARPLPRRRAARFSGIRRGNERRKLPPNPLLSFRGCLCHTRWRRPSCRAPVPNRSG
jgi:hypothetical protein